MTLRTYSALRLIFDHCGLIIMKWPFKCNMGKNSGWVCGGLFLVCAVLGLPNIWMGYLYNIGSGVNLKKVYEKKKKIKAQLNKRKEKNPQQ